MRGVTITDRTEDGGVLAIDLVDILRILGPEAANSMWVVRDVECIDGPAADELHRLSDTETRVHGQTLLELSAAVAQIIDGEFVGYRAGEEQPWVVIRAVDSSAYDVESEDDRMLARVRQSFKEVTDLPLDVDPK